LKDERPLESCKSEWYKKRKKRWAMFTGRQVAEGGIERQRERDRVVVVVYLLCEGHTKRYAACVN